MPTHTHTDAGHAHTVGSRVNPTAFGDWHLAVANGSGYFYNFPENTGYANIQNAGSSQAFSLLQPSRAALLVIKT
jgi:hypothetical protein